MNRIYNVRSLKQNEQSYNVPSKSLSEPRWKLLRLLSTSEATQTEYSEKNCIYSRCTMWCSHKCHSCYSLDWFFATPWIAAFQASLFFTKSQSLLKLMSIGPMMLSNHLIHCYVLFLLLSIFPRIRVFSNESALASGSQSTGASALVSVIPRNIQIWFPLGLIFFLSACCPRDFQESSPTSHFECISSSAYNPLYGPTLTSVQDYWKNHSFDSMDLCWQINISDF